jgi:hypothetical protein
MHTSSPMTREERSVYNLETTLISRHRFAVAPREVSLVDAVDFDGRAAEPRLTLARRVAGGPQAAALMTHLLIHYEMKDSCQPYWRGHGAYFVRRATELGVYSDAVSSRCFSIGDWLEEPYLRSGPHGVNARAIDVVFGLAGAYRAELMDFFSNERWLKGGHRLPDNLLPFVKFYAEELTDLLAVGLTVEKLTHERA